MQITFSLIKKVTNMEDFRIRPRDNYIENTTWEELYALTEHWKSDILFYRDDLKFLHHLLDKYFIWITKDENIKAVKSVGNKILADTKICKSLLKKIDKHLSHLAHIMDAPLGDNSKIFRKEHQVLEDEISLFIKLVRKDRKHVFAVTKHFMDSEQFVLSMGR